MTNIVILTGAGISAESGLVTFRDADGLWENANVEDLCSAEGFARNPYKVHDFYDARRAQLASASPNPAHVALAELETIWREQRRGDFTLVTQNVDNLHELGGSRNVLHMHGELASARCVSCGRSFYWERDLAVAEDCPACDEAALRPDVVMFGEPPYHRLRVESLVALSQIFIAIGTSGAVHPAAGLVQSASRNGAVTVEVNLRPTGNDDFQHVYAGAATEQVPRLVRDLVTGVYSSPF